MHHPAALGTTGINCALYSRSVDRRTVAHRAKIGHIDGLARTGIHGAGSGKQQQEGEEKPGQHASGIFRRASGDAISFSLWIGDGRGRHKNNKAPEVLLPPGL
ncbi:MAG TPA: hypothetical protein VHC95_01530 [Opitutales bacterium]|nr:hypothetical protein [Opitutales bacterium]